MSPGMKTVLLWVGVILVAAYLTDTNVAALIASIVHAGQQIHQSNAH